MVLDSYIMRYSLAITETTLHLQELYSSASVF